MWLAQGCWALPKCTYAEPAARLGQTENTGRAAVNLVMQVATYLYMHERGGAGLVFPTPHHTTPGHHTPNNTLQVQVTVSNDCHMSIAPRAQPESSNRADSRPPFYYPFFSLFLLSLSFFLLICFSFGRQILTGIWGRQPSESKVQIEHSVRDIWNRQDKMHCRI